MKKITQKCCEWMAFSKVMLLFSNIPVEVLMEKFSLEEMARLGSSAEKIGAAHPCGVVCFTKTSVSLSDDEITVIVKVIDWLDDSMVHYAQTLGKRFGEEFTQRYEQLGLIKRNFKLYATDEQTHTSETNSKSDDGAYECGTGTGNRH